MGAMKTWFEDHISEFTDEQLLDMGYNHEDIDTMREAFASKTEES